MILTITYRSYNLCRPFGSCSALVGGIYPFIREMYQSKRGHQIGFREHDHLLLSQNLALNKNGYLSMPAMLYAEISRKSGTLRKCNIMRNKSMSLTTRRMSSTDNIAFFGPNGLRCNRLKRRRKVVAVETVCFVRQCCYLFD